MSALAGGRGAGPRRGQRSFKEGLTGPIAEAVAFGIEPLELRVLLASTPFTGSPLQLPQPGAAPLTIQAENFDNGGEGVAYHDTDAGNVFKSTYRPGTDVDVFDTTAASNGHLVGWTKADEWLKYTVSASAANSYHLTVNTASVGLGGKFHVELDGVNVSGALAAPDTGDWLKFQTVDGGTFNVGVGQHVIRLVMDSSQQSNGYMANVDSIAFAAVPPPSPDGTPFTGAPITIAASGASTIEAENFNNGAEGVAYHDTDAANVFGSSYRAGTGVDVYDTTAASNGHLVGWTKAGEWLKYTVNVPTGGSYHLGVNAASVGAGGQFHFEVDGQNVTGTLAAPDTGDWLKFQTIDGGTFNLATGQHVIRLVFDTAQQSNGYMANFDNFILTSVGSMTLPPPGQASAPNPGDGATLASSPTVLRWTSASNAQSYDVILDGAFAANVTATQWNVDRTLAAGSHTWQIVAKNTTGTNPGPTWSFTVSAPPPPSDGTPFTGTPLAVAASGTTTIEAENFNNGGQGVAYNDTDASNVFGSSYRSGTGVDVYDTTAASNGHLVGWTKAGEWLKYTVNVGTAGNYSIAASTASVGAGGMFHVELDGQNVTGSLSAPDTTDWLKFQSVSGGTIALTAGQHVIRLVMDSSRQSNGYMANFDNLSLTAVAASGNGAQPDLQIRNYGDTFYQGDNVYNTNGINQVVGQTVPFFPAIYQVRIQNDGSVADSFNITGPGPIPPNWHVWYFPDQVQQYAGAPEVTAQVTGGGWNTGTIQPGQFRDFRFEAGPTANDAANDSYLIALTATSASDPSKVDVVKANTVNGVRREVEIRRRNVASPGPYAMDIQNEGNITDQYTISGTGNGTGYTVSFFDDAAMTHDVTAAVVGGTYTTAPLAHLGLQTLLVRITPTDGQNHAVTITATSKGDGSIQATSTISTAPPPAAPPIFSIGVYSQPEFEFDTWKQRGINTLVGYESFGGQNSIDEWSQVAVDKGLYMIRQPRANPASDINQANLLAWMQPDEPELRSDYPASTAVQNYNTWKAADPNIPVLENFAGGYVMGWQGNISPATYQAYAQGADWISSGIYPVDGWARPEDLDVSGRSLDRLQSLTNGKPQFAIIESGPQNGSWLPKGFPGPTATQFRAEVWDSVIHGAQGIIYFPQSLNPTFSYDNTPADVAAEMTTQNARLTSIGAALVSPIDPPTLGLTAASPLEATWRSYGGKSYFIVLNMSSQTLSNQQMTLRGAGAATTATVQGENRSLSISGGVMSDNFAPYEAHIYVV